MKKLSKDDLKAREEVVKNLKDKFEELTQGVADYNDTMATAWETLDAIQNAYNEAVHAAGEWCEGIVSQIDDYVSEKSEKWQEGEKAEAYESWKSAYDDVDCSESELSQPDELSVEVEDPAETIEGLPVEVES